LTIDYIGDKMVSLDFGKRQFVLEGEGLAELPMWLQQGLVLTVQEFSSTIWTEGGEGPIVRRIVHVSSAKANSPEY
jgi:hypothetical protein